MSNVTSIFTAPDHIDEHARQAWALAELLVVHYTEDHSVMSDDIMSCLMENISSHLEEIRKLALACTEERSAQRV